MICQMYDTMQPGSDHDAYVRVTVAVACRPQPPSQPPVNLRLLSSVYTAPGGHEGMHDRLSASRNEL